MVWIIIGIVFGMLIIVALFGDYEQEEIKRDYRKYEELINGEYYKTKNMCSLSESVHMWLCKHRQK